MWRNKIILLFVALLTIGGVKAEDKLVLPSIPDSLKNNAYSVIRLYEQEFNYLSDVSGTQKETLIITILDPKGKGAANFNCSCDKFRSLKKFRGEIYDANGNLVRKIKQSELTYSEYFEGLASDQNQYFYEYDPSGYPFTIKYEWEIKHQNGLIGLPVFLPQRSDNQSVEKAIYKLYAPESTDFIYKAINMSVTPEKKSDKNGSYKEWTSINKKALEDEPFIESWIHWIPRLYIVPRLFSYDGTQGDMSNWNSFGKWQYSLLDKRDLLPDATKQKLAELTKDCKTDREKVKAIYDYLAKTTRYVSIQLGIGGLQPTSATEVAKMGFSDCKGLSNYAKAMLKEVGIASNYTVISTQQKKLLADFASANQMNHVILQVPLAKDTVWLECTAPEIPFGYIHSNIAGNDALVVTENGGVFCKLPEYSDEKNKESHNATIIINEDGKATANVTQTSHLMQYEEIFGFAKLAPNKQIDLLRENISLPEALINNISYIENKSAEPSIAIKYNFACEKFGSKTGNRMFVPINVLRQELSRVSNKKRKEPISIKYGYMDSDTITIEVPANYAIESIPSTQDISNNFTKFSSKISKDGNKITIIHHLLMHKGKYDAKLYPDFIAFRKEISNTYKSSIVLKKKE